MKYELSFSSQSNNASIVHAVFEPLPSGSYGRLLVLTDQDTFYVTIHLISESAGINIIRPPRLINGVTYQENEAHEFISDATFDSFRGVNYHFTFNHFSAYPDDIGYDNASWPILGEDRLKTADYIY